MTRGHMDMEAIGDERYRIRQRKYRIVYSIQDQELTIWIVKIGHRRDIYKKLT